MFQCYNYCNEAIYICMTLYHSYIYIHYSTYFIFFCCIMILCILFRPYPFPYLYDISWALMYWPELAEQWRLLDKCTLKLKQRQSCAVTYPRLQKNEPGLPPHQTMIYCLVTPVKTLTHLTQKTVLNLNNIIHRGLLSNINQLPVVYSPYSSILCKHVFCKNYKINYF